jgi:hypothetical protein
MVDKPSQKVAAGLNERHERDQDDDHRNHDRGLEPLIAVADREVTEASRPNGPGHRRGSDQQHQRHCEARDQAWQRLRNERLADDRLVSPAHSPHRLDEPAIDFAEGDLGDAAEVGNA